MALELDGGGGPFALLNNPHRDRLCSDPTFCFKDLERPRRDPVLETLAKIQELPWLRRTPLVQRRNVHHVHAPALLEHHRELTLVERFCGAPSEELG